MNDSLFIHKEVNPLLLLHVHHSFSPGATKINRMSSGGTRAARASSSRQVKQELVRLLFGKKYSKTGPEGHKKLDYASYSYGDLKRAYFERLQEIHPDKNKSTQMAVLPETKESFLALQDAWDKYEDLAKALERVRSKGQGNFTKFGVGCSFSDSDEERALRNEITDQACRGWFSSGLLSAESSKSGKDVSTKIQVTSLIDDDLFVEVESESSAIDQVAKDEARTSNKKTPLKTLIPGFKG